MDRAQADVNNKQAVLDGTGQQAVLDEAKAASTGEATQKLNLDAAKQAVSDAKAADKKRDDAISDAQGTVDQANQQVASTKTSLDAKTENAAKAQASLSSAQSTYQIADNDYKAMNTITMSPEYAKALKDAFNYSLTVKEQDAAEAVLRELAETEAAKNVFKHNDNDKKQAFDINHVTDAQAQELSLFAADLINQARKAVGSNLVAVSAESADEAQKHAERYAASDATMWTFDHDTSDLKAKYGWVDEDWASGWFNTSSWLNPLTLGDETMDDAKYYVYDAITRWIFAPDEWLHASSVVGTRNATEGDNYIGIGLSRLKDGSLSTSLNIFNTVYSNLSHFDKTPLVDPKSSDKVVAAYNKAKTAYDSAQADYNNANTALDQAKSAYQTAVAKLASSSQDLEKAKAVAVKTPAAQKALEAAQTAYDKAADRLAKANQAVESLTADVKVKQDNLAKAKEVLLGKQAVLTQKQDALATEQNRLNAAKETLVSAQNNVNKAKANLEAAKANVLKAQDYLTRLQNAPKLLATAKQEEAKAKANLLDALDTLESELETLQALQSEQEAAKAAYDATSKAYQEVLEAKAKQQLQADYQAIVAKGQTPVPVVNETGKIVAYVAQESNDAPTTTKTEETKGSNTISTVSSTETKVAAKVVNTLKEANQTPTKSNANQLPMTGESQSMVAMMMGGLLTLWGLVGIRRKQH